MSNKPKLLITAGPTHEPIDAVRAIVNRSSGRLGCALADAAAAGGWDVRILIGPTPIRPQSPMVEPILFSSTESLRERLMGHLPWCDALVMAAAVADFRPVGADLGSKLRRTDGEMVLHLEPTPDLLAGASAKARQDQLLIGFALEPRATMLESARSKLERKGVHAIVANPLETMDSPNIEATLVGAPGSGFDLVEPTPGLMTKQAFAAWLVERIERARTRAPGGCSDA